MWLSSALHRGHDECARPPAVSAPFHFETFRLHLVARDEEVFNWFLLLRFVQPRPSPLSPCPGLLLVFACRFRSCASERPTSSDSLNLPVLSRRAYRLSLPVLINSRFAALRFAMISPCTVIRPQVEASVSGARRSALMRPPSRVSGRILRPCLYTRFRGTTVARRSSAPRRSSIRRDRVKPRLIGIIATWILHGANGSQDTRQAVATRADHADDICPFFEPMALLRTDSLPTGEQWLYELKAKMAECRWLKPVLVGNSNSWNRLLTTTYGIRSSSAYVRTRGR